MKFLESEIRPAALLNEYLRLSAIDAKNFFSDSSSLEHRACPGCGGKTHNPAFNKNGFSLVHCDDCQSLFVNPAPDDKSLVAFYNDSPSTSFWADKFFPAVAETRRSKIIRPRAISIISILSEQNITPQITIDVGAGTGLFLEEYGFLMPDVELCAIEPGKILANKLRENKHDVFEVDAASAAKDLKWQSRGDLVTCFEVIEHIVDVEAFLRSLHDLCHPGGIIIVTGLCGTGFDLTVLGQESKAISPPHHLSFLSPLGVAQSLKRSGLELLSFFTPGVLDVDIVRNSVRENSEIPLDPFIQNLVLKSSAETRDAFQEFLQNNALSSHMWIVAKRPDQPRQATPQK
jgi:SAM-dependent methyltransferase